MGSILSPVFTGVSSYASTLQQVITRSVRIAALPLQQLQNRLQDLNGESAALQGLDQDFGALQSALDAIHASLGSASYSASSSDPGAVTANAGAGALEASYTLDITDIGSYSNTISDSNLPGVSDPTTSSFSDSTDYTLTIDGQTFDIQPSDGSLNALARAINESSADVEASLVNTGSSSAPQYRLVVRSSDLGPVSIQLNDGARDLLTGVHTGSLASYTVNGLDTSIPSGSRTITLAPGVTATFLQETPAGQPATVTVGRRLDSAASAVSDFVDAYNTVVDHMARQIGQNAGALSGQSIIGALHDTLRQITQYNSGSGAIASLSQMGVTLDSTGHLSFDRSKFDAGGIDSVETFLGDSITSGFLKTAADALGSVEDSSDGILKTAVTRADHAITRQNDLISDSQEKLSDMETRLEQQMAEADSLIASLESRRDYFNNLFTAMINNASGGVKTN